MAREDGITVRALVVINPGNPTGQVHASTSVTIGEVKVLFADGIFAETPVSNTDMLGNSNFYPCTLSNCHFLLSQIVTYFWS